MYFALFIWWTFWELYQGVYATNCSETLTNCTYEETLSGFQHVSDSNSSTTEDQKELNFEASSINTSRFDNSSFQQSESWYLNCSEMIDKCLLNNTELPTGFNKNSTSAGNSGILDQPLYGENCFDIIRKCGYNESELRQVDGNNPLHGQTGTNSLQQSINGTVHRYRGRDVLICHGFSCADRCDAPRQNLTVAECFCDEVCVFYRDCCFDFFQECNFNISVGIQLKSLTDQEPHCSHIFQQEHALLVDHCHGNWSRDKERSQCEDEAVEVDDIFTIIPVTHKAVQVAFKNIYCARCNFLKLDDLQYWEFNISCLDDNTLDMVVENGVSLSTLNILRDEGCHIRLRPHDPELINHVRFCNPRFVNACRSEYDHDVFSAFNMTQNTDQLGDSDACQDYAAYVITPEYQFARYVAKNTHCALCIDSNLDIRTMTCPRPQDLLLDFYMSLRDVGLPPFSLLLDFNGYHWSLTRRTESQTECSNNFFLHNGMCRETICQFGSLRKDEMCIPFVLGDSNIRFEFLVSSSGAGVGVFHEILLHEAHDHGVSVGNITAEKQTDKNISTVCDETKLLSTTSNLMDFDIMIPQNASSLLAVLSYIDDLINFSHLNLANVRISNVAYDIHNYSVCRQIDNFTLVINSTSVLLLSADDNLLESEDVFWQISWESRCIDGLLKTTTNKLVKGCNRREASCLLVEMLENEVDELSSNVNKSQITVLNGSRYVCSSVLKNMSSSLKSNDSEGDITERVVTVVLLSISMTALMFTLITHCVIHRLKSLPGKIVLSLSVAILLAQAFFLSLSAASTIQWLCKAVAIIDHFLWLSTFSWSNILALDLEITLTQSTKIGGSRDNGQPFLRYSIYGWGVPVVIVSMVCLASFTTDLPISYGNDKVCWIFGKEALLFTLALPVALAVILNCFLLSRAIFFVYKVGKLVKNASIVQDQKLRGFLYVKLISLMGLTWLFGILGTIFRSTVLMYFFTVLNALQGVYIFIAFVANKRVFMFYWKLITAKAVTSKYLSSQKSTASFTSASRLSSN